MGIIDNGPHGELIVQKIKLKNNCILIFIFMYIGEMCGSSETSAIYVQYLECLTLPVRAEIVSLETLY